MSVQLPVSVKGLGWGGGSLTSLVGFWISVRTVTRHEQSPKNQRSKPDSESHTVERITCGTDATDSGDGINQYTNESGDMFI